MGVLCLAGPLEVPITENPDISRREQMLEEKIESREDLREMEGRKERVDGWYRELEVERTSSVESSL